MKELIDKMMSRRMMILWIQIKPTVLRWRTKPREEVEPYGVSPVKSWDVTLEVLP